MGAHSSLSVTRSKAQQIILSLLQDDSKLLRTETLGLIMDVFLDGRLYNCVIVPDDCTENDDDYVESLLNN
jgi:hypothetical protein